MKDVLNDMTELHLQIHALRSLAYCENPELLRRFADQVLSQSNAAIQALREQVTE